MKTKRITLVLSVIVLAVLTWYLFIKPYDYLVTFKAKSTPSIINQSIISWNKTLTNNTKVSQATTTKLSQKVFINDSTYNYNWKITAINDSTSKVKVYVKDLDHSFINKLKIPFSNTNFEKTTKRTLLNFNKELNGYLKKFRVKVVGIDSIEGTHCAYVPIKTARNKKARGMMQNYSMLDNFMFKNNLKLNGKPRIEIVNWNTEQDSITYNFCYPIIKSDSLPDHPLIKYKQLEDKVGLKAIYNGNYITSDKAWYILQDYAKMKKMTIAATPIEVFHNNPNMGGNELNWKTEVYMPIE